MTCEECRDRLDEHLAGRLDDSAAAAVQAHLDSCSECHADEAAARFLAPRIAALPREVRPARPLWAGIDRRLTHAPSRPWRRWLAVAAALAIMTGLAWSSAVMLRWAQHPSGPGRTPPVATREMIWRDAATELETSLLAGKHLAPAVEAAVRRDMGVLDTAIREAGDALRADPGNPLLEDLYLGALRRKLEVLRRAAALYTES